MIEYLIRRLKKNKLVFLADLCGIPQTDIARHLGISTTMVSLMKTRQKTPSRRMQRKIDELHDRYLRELADADHPATHLIDAIIDHGESL